MGKYELKKLYQETDVTRPNKLQVGETLWSMITQASKADKLLCVNPTTFGQEFIGVIEYPETIANQSIFLESGLFNYEVTKIPVFLEITRADSGYYEGKVLDESEWPDLVREEDDLFITKRENSIEWEGTPQRSQSSSSKRQSSVFSEDNVVGTKNDLIK